LLILEVRSGFVSPIKKDNMYQRFEACQITDNADMSKHEMGYSCHCSGTRIVVDRDDMCVVVGLQLLTRITSYDV